MAASIIYGCGYLFLLWKGAQNDAHCNCIKSCQIKLHVLCSVSATLYILLNQKPWKNRKNIFISLKKLQLFSRLFLILFLFFSSIFHSKNDFEQWNHYHVLVMTSCINICKCNFWITHCELEHPSKPDPRSLSKEHSGK